MVSREPRGRREADQHLIGAIERNVGFTGLVVRTVAEHLNDDIGRTENIGARRENLRSFGSVFSVQISGFFSRASFDDNFQTRLCEARDYGGHHRYTALSRKGFSWHSDNHEASSGILSATSELAHESSFGPPARHSTTNSNRQARKQISARMRVGYPAPTSLPGMK